MFKESEFIELKSEYIVEIKKEIIAFANTKGGTVYIGIDDNGTVCGIDNVQEIMLNINNMIRDSIRPDITMFTKVSAEIIDSKNVVKIEVNVGSNAPYYIYEKGLKPSGVYIRNGAASVPASDLWIRNKIKEIDGDKYEIERSLNQELNFTYTKTQFENKGLEFNDEKARTLGLINENMLYTNLGLLLSNECPHSIKIAVFKGKNKDLFKDRKEITGSLIEQLNKAYEYISLRNNINSTFEGLYRVDQKDYPEQALREALLNLVVHRDYGISGSAFINIYDDRIEMVSLGGLVPGITLNELKLGISKPRNEKLANIFYRLELIEAYGTGIKKILSAYEKNNQQPVFEVTDGAFLISLPNINYTDIVKDSRSILLDYLVKNKTINRKTAEKLLGLKQTATINLLRKLESEGVIIKSGGSKNIIYVLK